MHGNAIPSIESMSYRVVTEVDSLDWPKIVQNPTVICTGINLLTSMELTYVKQLAMPVMAEHYYIFKYVMLKKTSLF